MDDDFSSKVIWRILFRLEIFSVLLFFLTTTGKRRKHSSNFYIFIYLFIFELKNKDEIENSFVMLKVIKNCIKEINLFFRNFIKSKQFLFLYDYFVKISLREGMYNLSRLDPGHLLYSMRVVLIGGESLGWFS